jgi:sugar phosphate permease
LPSLALALSRRLPFFYGWVVVAVGFLTLGMGASVRAVFSLLFPPIIAEFGWDRGLTASVFSVGFIFAALAFPLMGAAIDRWGPQWILAIGAASVAVGFMLTTQSSTPLHFFLTLGLIVVGGSTSFAYNGHFIFLPSWFERRRGLAIGIACTGAGVISITLFPQLQLLIDQGGWRTGCWVMAIVLLAVIVPLNLALQRRRPEDLGLEPDGEPKGSVGAQSSSVIVDPEWARTDWTLGKALRTARFWFYAIGFFLALFAWYAILVHQTKFLLDSGFSSTFAALALGMVPMFGVGGQLMLGALSDRIGREWIWTLGCTGFFICYLLMFVLARNPDPLIVWGLVFAQGFLGYGMTPALGAVPADLFQGRSYGRIFGVAAIFGSSGASLGPWVFGLIYDRTGSYDVACLMAMSMCVASAALIWMAGPRRVRKVGRRAAA